MQFSEFPRSYRFSQFGIAAALVFTVFGGSQARHLPPPMDVILWSFIGLVVLSSLLVSNYVIIKYPYISLVEPEDGDYFSLHFKSAGSPLYFILKVAGFLAVIVTIVTVFLLGFENWWQAITTSYLFIMAFFLFFFAFIYEPVKHSTVTTMIRATLGLGIVLYPFFMISVFIGSQRSQALLEERLNETE